MIGTQGLAHSWFDKLSSENNFDQILKGALETSLVGQMESPSDLEHILAAEKVIVERLPEKAWLSLSQVMKEGGGWDGHLRLWRGLLFQSEKKYQEAYREFLEATRVSFPLPIERVLSYCQAIRDNENGASFPRPGQPVFGDLSLFASGKVENVKSEKSYYGSDYFSFQKTIGAFGGVANRFKFLPFVAPDASLVDFGSGGGYLLRNLPGRRKIGIELNPVARSEALNVGGIRSVESSQDLPDEYADVIISNHALEHVHDPLQVLSSLRRILRIGGKIVFVLPYEGPGQAYDPRDVNKHLFTWNPQTLGNLFQSAGFNVLQVEAIQHQWPAGYENIYRGKGEEAFHAACRDQAVSTGNYQIRLVAVRDPQPTIIDPVLPFSNATKKSPIENSGGRPDPRNLPIVLVAYKRAEHTRKVLEGLRNLGATNLTIFLDGCKKDQDMIGVAETRRLCKAVDWVKPIIVERQENHGLAKSIMAAADYMLDRYENMILLEDDCVPQKYFLEFMSRCLEKYRHEPTILGISGYTVPLNEEILNDYPFDLYFAPRIGSWGWATWSRAWRLLERDLPNATRKALDQKIDLLQGGNDIPHILEAQLTNPLTDTWTLNWVLTTYLRGGSFIYPTVSHIDNIGMDGTGVHCGATEKYRTPLAATAPSRFPDGVIRDAAILKRFRSFYDLG